MHVLVVRRLHRALRHIVSDIDGRVLFIDDLLEESRVDPIAPRPLDEARVDRRRDRVRVVRLDSRAPEEAFPADGLALGEPHPGSRNPHRVRAVDLQWVFEAGEEVWADGDVEFGADRGMKIWHSDDGRVEGKSEMTARVVSGCFYHRADLDHGVGFEGFLSRGGVMMMMVVVMTVVLVWAMVVMVGRIIGVVVGS